MPTSKKPTLWYIISSLILLTFGIAQLLLTWWHNRLIGLKLINEYYQEQAIPTASMFGAGAFLLSFAMLRQSEPEQLKKLIKLWTAVFFLCVALCLFFSWTVGNYFAPGQTGDKIILAIWFCLYFTIFIALSVILCSTLLLVGVGGAGRPPAWILKLLGRGTANESTESD